MTPGPAEPHGFRVQQGPAHADHRRANDDDQVLKKRAILQSPRLPLGNGERPLDTPFVYMFHGKGNRCQQTDQGAAQPPPRQIEDAPQGHRNDAKQQRIVKTVE